MPSKIVIAFSAIAMVAVYAFANPKVDFKADTEEGIQFHNGTWEEALQLAKKENKLIFLDIYATWCGPCKKLKANTFSNTEVGSYYNQNYINVAFDGEQGEGAMLMQKYGLRSFPSLLFIDGNGKVVGQTVGYHNPSQFLELGQKFSKK
jgi:thiol:disulfide interchange protein